MSTVLIRFLPFRHARLERELSCDFISQDIVKHSRVRGEPEHVCSDIDTKTNERVEVLGNEKKGEWEEGNSQTRQTRVSETAEPNYHN